MKGFHLKISPSGRRRYALDVTRGGYRHYEAIGDADQISLEDARVLARQKADALSLATRPHPLTRDHAVRFEALAELTFRRRTWLWKASTLRVNRDYLKNQIMPFFKNRAVASISREDVAAWFGGLSHMPEGANRAVPVLSVIMNEAEDLGLRPQKMEL